MTGPQRAHDMRSSAARVIVFLGIGAVLLWLVLRGQNLTLVRERLADAYWGWAVLSLAFAALSQLIRAARWNLLIHPLGYRPRLVNTTGAVLVGYLANLAIPRVGEVARCGVLLRYEKTPFDRLFGTVVTERIIDVLTILFFLALVVLLEYDRMASLAMQHIVDPIRARFEVLFRGPAVYFAVIGVAFAVFVVARVVYRQWRGSRYVARLVDALRGFLTGVRTVEHLERRTRFAVFSIVIWVLYAMMAYACFQCFPATSGLGATAALAVLVFGGLGFAAPVQGGLGAFEIVVTPVLMAFGVPTGDALAYAILYHVTQVFGMAIFGLAALVTLPLVNRREPIEASK